ncbi:MAG: DUF3604 domain-containing protein [Bryobacteraceae bacterium]
MESTYWAELHNHNEIGYGKGSLDRSYLLAGNLLDVYAFVPHGWWPDSPSEDPKVRDYHLNAFDAVRDSFPRVCAKANDSYEPGKFVALLGYGWHSSKWGDYHVLFPGSTGSLCRAADVRELQQFVRSGQALMIPHHCAYRAGWRGTAWDFWEADVSPVAEAFSEHGNSLEEESLVPLLNHSMGGSLRSQTILAQLRLGRRMGLTAGTDNHYGHPASYGEGVTGIVAEELTRDAIFDALRSRHTFVVSGDRIDLRVRSGDRGMGDFLDAAAPRILDIDVAPLAPLEFVQVLKNGEPAAIWHGVQAGAPAAARRLVRLEWGWGRLGSLELTDWRIRVTIRGGSLGRALPCLTGGAGSTELLNRIHPRSPQELEIESFTSRLNPRPTSAAVLDMYCDPATAIDVYVRANSNGVDHACEIHTTVGELEVADVTEPISQVFSAPKIRIGRPYASEALRFRANWKDEHPGRDDFYMVKAQQRNGQCAWSSPLWFSAGQET